MHVVRVAFEIDCRLHANVIGRLRQDHLVSEHVGSLDDRSDDHRGYPSRAHLLGSWRSLRSRPSPAVIGLFTATDFLLKIAVAHLDLQVFAVCRANVRTTVDVGWFACRVRTNHRITSGSVGHHGRDFRSYDRVPLFWSFSSCACFDCTYFSMICATAWDGATLERTGLDPQRQRKMRLLKPE